MPFTFIKKYDRASEGELIADYGLTINIEYKRPDGRRLVSSGKLEGAGRIVHWTLHTFTKEFGREDGLCIYVVIETDTTDQLHDVWTTQMIADGDTVFLKEQVVPKKSVGPNSRT